MFMGKPTDDIKVPTLEEASARYAALKAREAELDKRRATLHAEIQSIAAEERKRQLTRAPVIDRDRVAAAEEKARRAGALIGDLMPVPSLPAPAPPSDAIKHIVTLEDELSDIVEALRLLKQEIRRETVEASKTVCAVVRDEHDRRAALVADAFARLLHAAQEYQGLAGKLNKRGIQWARLTPLPIESAIGVIGSRFAGHISPLVSAMTKRGDLDLSKLKSGKG